MDDFLSSPWWGVVTSTVATASLLANLTPNKTDNVVIKVIASFIDALALNFKKGGKK